MKTKLVQVLCFGILVCFALTAKATVLTEAQKPSAEAFRSMRYGLLYSANSPVAVRVAPSGISPIKQGCVFSKSPSYGATRSLDGSREYIHILKAPEGKSIDLETVSEVFKSARLLTNGHPVKMEPLAKGLRLTLSDADQWDPLDTVIELEREKK